MKHPIKKALLPVVAFLLLSFYVNAQSTGRRTVINTMQAGTLTINHGIARVDLADEVLAELRETQTAPVYYVVFTPVGRQADIVLLDKGEKSFSVKAIDSKNSTDGLSVDYVVYVRQSYSVPDPGLLDRKRPADTILK